MLAGPDRGTLLRAFFFIAIALLSHWLFDVLGNAWPRVWVVLGLAIAVVWAITEYLAQRRKRRDRRNG